MHFFAIRLKLLTVVQLKHIFQLYFYASDSEETAAESLGELIVKTARQITPTTARNTVSEILQ